LDKCSPVYLIGGLIDPVFERAIAVDGGGGQAFKKEQQILQHGVLVVSLWAAHLLLVVATGHDHASQQLIIETLDSLPDKVNLLGGNHVFNVQYVVEYASDLGIPNSFFLHTHHVDGKNVPDTLMQEDLEFVDQALSEQPCLATP
jgi:hypothetical protein